VDEGLGRNAKTAVGSDARKGIPYTGHKPDAKEREMVESLLYQPERQACQGESDRKTRMKVRSSGKEQGKTNRRRSKTYSSPRTASAGTEKAQIRKTQSIGWNE